MKVTVCMPTRNRATQLSRALGMVLVQTFPHFELIIWDDASDDETPHVVSGISDSRIRYLRNKHRLGIPSILNACLGLARGEYVLFLHDHDFYASNLLEELVRCLDDHPTVGFVHPGVYQADQEGRLVRSDVHSFPLVMPGRDMAAVILGRWDCPVTGLSMIRRSCLGVVGEFDTRFGFIADVDLWIRLSLQFDVGYVAKPLVGLHPREDTHPLAQPNWNVVRWLSAIHEENLRGFYAGRPHGSRLGLARFHVRRTRLMLRTILSCYQRGSTVAQKTGIDLFEHDASLVLRLFGWTLRRFPILSDTLRYMLPRIAGPTRRVTMRN